MAIISVAADADELLADHDGLAPAAAGPPLRFIGEPDDVLPLLRDIENHEGRLPESERFDVGPLRTALGMDE